MPNKKSAGLPEHLVPLLEPTPSGAAKLVAVWDGLNTESQILILTRLETAGLPAYLNEKVRIKALDSANAYVRYLAARRLYFGTEDTKEKKGVKQRIEEDPDPLVRYCLLESSWGLFGRDMADADAFFALPQEARLAKVRSLSGSGEEMANLIGYAVDHQLKEGKVSAIEVFEILSDYINKTEFKKHYGPDNESYDGLIEFGRGKDVDALWRLALKVPEVVSHILIANLPPGAGLSSGIPEDVLSGMNDGQMITLFKRDDIDLRDLRRKVFFQAGAKQNELKDAAISCNFDLDYTEFAGILIREKNEAGKIINDLTHARSLSLCLYEAIYDVVLNGGVGEALDAEFARKAFDRRLEQLKGSKRKQQLRDLNLYQLAKQAVPWQKGETGCLPSEELDFLSKAVVEGDTWRTFIAYSKILAENTPNSWKLEKHLAQFDDPVEDEATGELDAEDEDKNTELLDRIEEKLTETLSSLTQQTDDKHKELTDNLNELEEKLTETVSTKTREAEETQTALARKLTADITRLLYVAIGLLVWLLIKLY